MATSGYPALIGKAAGAVGVAVVAFVLITQIDPGAAPRTHASTQDATGPGKYDRERQFGSSWRTVHGKCDVREVLLEQAAIGPPRDTDGDGCGDDGPVRDAYGLDPGTRTDVLQPAGAEIDHVVPLKLVWSGGAWRWTKAQRVAMANDLDNLVVTSEHTNGTDKSDDGPDEWTPADPSRRCFYADRWSQVVSKYRLTWPPAQTDAYHQALRQMCPQ